MDNYNNSEIDNDSNSEITPDANEQDINNTEQPSDEPLSNGYNHMASSNREAFTRGLDNNYQERIARNKANLQQSINRSNETQKTNDDGETKEKNILDKAGDKANVLKNKASLLSSQIDSARSKAFQITHPVEAAKIAAKQKVKKWLLGILIGSPTFIFGIFVVLIAALQVSGVFDSDNDYVAGDYAHIHSAYSYCESITAGGKLYPFEEYIARVVQKEAYTSENEEALKAQAIASRTYALYTTNGCKEAIGNSTAQQTFFDGPKEDIVEAALNAANSTEAMVLAYGNDLFLSQYDSFCYADNDCPDSVINANGTYSVQYERQPTGEMHTITLSDSSLYNRIPPGEGHANGMSQLFSYQLAREGKNYEEILKFFYSDGVQIIDLNNLPIGSENVESGVGYTSTYTNPKNGKTYRNYKQGSFLASNFSDSDFPQGSSYHVSSSSKKDSIKQEGAQWLEDYGCGLTSVAIVSSGDNIAITPTYLYGHQRFVDGQASLSSCMNKQFSSGVDYSKKEEKVKNMKNELVSTLSNGGTAIFFITSSNTINGNSWTGWQHFFAVLDYDPSTKMIYVSNPGNSNENQNGWLPLDYFDEVEVTYLIY